MGNFFTSLFSSSKNEDTAEGKIKNDQKNFDILKYDGVRAQKIGQVAYAIKCFTEALNIQEVEICPWALREGAILRWLDQFGRTRLGF